MHQSHHHKHQLMEHQKVMEQFLNNQFMTQMPVMLQLQLKAMEDNLQQPKDTVVNQDTIKTNSTTKTKVIKIKAIEIFIQESNNLEINLNL